MQSEARKLALITGGVSGIGAALVERLLNQGFRVVVADAVAATKPELLRASGGLLEYVEVDVADRAQVVGLFSKLARHLARRSTSWSIAPEYPAMARPWRYRLHSGIECSK
jgi:NAD(P)-dependent dehydrogenase (short-subunit alcohol dehydrogenase family)